MFSKQNPSELMCVLCLLLYLIGGVVILYSPGFTPHAWFSHISSLKYDRPTCMRTLHAGMHTHMHAFMCCYIWVVAYL